MELHASGYVWWSEDSLEGVFFPSFTLLRQSALLFLPHCAPQHTCSLLFSVVLGIKPGLYANHVSTLPPELLQPSCTHPERNIKLY